MSPNVAGKTHRSITLAFIMSFAVSFAFLYWKQKSQQVPEPVARPLDLRPVERPRLVPPLTAPSVEQAPPPAPRTAPLPAPAAEANVEGPAVPVLYRITRRRVRAGDDGSPDDMVDVSELHLSNSSDKRLIVTVIDLNLPTMTTSQTQVLVGANADAQVGADGELKMQSGDRITLKSPGFTELVFPVP